MEQGLLIHVEQRFPQWLVKHGGAPAKMWTIYHAPSDSDQLHLTLVWQNKTATRLPEALWLRFKPSNSGDVNPDSWVMHKIGSNIYPHEVKCNHTAPARNMFVFCSH